MAEVIFYHAHDSPEANGRLPQAGDVRYDLSFALDDGRTLVVCVGQTGLESFTTMLREMAVDDALDAALGESQP